MERRYLHRILIVMFATSLVFGLILARLFYLQLRRHDRYVELAARIHTTSVKITPHRGGIYSRGGQPLAATEVRETLYAVPPALRKQPDLRRRLAMHLADRLGLERSEVDSRLESSRPSVVIARKLPREDVLAVSSLCAELGLPSGVLYFAKEGKRIYPQGSLAAHVVGYTQPDDFGDNVGVAGVEGAYDDQVKGEYGKERVEVSSTRLELSPVEDEAFLRATGNDLHLTVDLAVQHYAEAALAAQVEKYEAQGGVCIVMEVGTGAVLAMASLPTFDLNRRGEYPIASLTNRCLVHSIPPGSVMKVFTTAALLEHNRLSPYEMVDCHRGQIFYPSRSTPIRDTHRMGVVPVHTAFAESSNVAYSYLGQRLSRQEFYDSLRRFRFGDPTGIDLPGESGGILHPVKRWSGASIISLSIGYEITLTPVQVAAAMAAIANGGKYVRPHVLQEVRSPAGELVYRAEPEAVGTVCSPQTSEIVLRMMEEVVADGTGKNAAVEGYRVGGKTGTTRKHDRPGSDDGPSYYASFLGVLPVDAPRLVIYTWIDDPNGKWGGAVAAPVFKHVAEHAVRVLNIPPSAPPSAPEPARPPAVVAATAGLALPGAPMGAGRRGKAGGGPMPNLTGMTLREAAEALSALGLDAQMVGWGTVVRQQPEPGAPIEPHARGLIVLQPGEQTAAE